MLACITGVRHVVELIFFFYGTFVLTTVDATLKQTGAHKVLLAVHDRG